MDSPLVIGWYVYSFIFLMGLVLGSFLNSWIWRRWENIRIISGRSICIHCRRQLNWYENIPLASFFWLRGRCRTCHRDISWHYPLLELFVAVALVFVAWYRVNFGLFTPWLFFRDVFFVGFLTVVFIFDALHQIILSEVIWVGAIIGLILNLYIFHHNWPSLFVAAAVAGGFFALQYVLSKGRWIGGGDVRLGVMMGFWVGWPGIIFSLFSAYIIGGIVAAFLLISGRKKIGSAMPFGTFLSVGTVLGIYFGNEAINWFASLYK